MSGPLDHLTGNPWVAGYLIYEAAAVSGEFTDDELYGIAVEINRELPGPPPAEITAAIEAHIRTSTPEPSAEEAPRMTDLLWTPRRMG